MNIGNWIQIMTLLIMIFTAGVSHSEKESEKIVKEYKEYSADYDGDGREETFWYVFLQGETHNIEKEETGVIEIWYTDENQEPVLVDSIVTMEEYQEWMQYWILEDSTVTVYQGQTVMSVQLYLAGSNGWGYYRQILYGMAGKEPVKIKDEEGWGDYLSITYMYDGSVKEVQDSDFLAFLEETESKGYECDINGDGEADLYLSQYWRGIYEKTEAGIVCRFSWEPPEASMRYANWVLQEDGTVMTYYEIGGAAFYGWVEEFYRFDPEWNTEKDVYQYLVFTAEDLKYAEEEEKIYLQETFFGDTDLETLESGTYVFLNGVQVEMVQRQED